MINSTAQPPTILFYTIPATGHVFSMLVFMDTLVSNGYRVIVYASNNYQEVIEQTGAIFKPYACNPSNVDLKDGARLLRFHRIVLQYTFALLPELLTEAKVYAPSFIVHDAAAHWGFRVAQHLAIPATSYCSFICVGSWHSRVALQYFRNFCLSSISDIPELYHSSKLIYKLKQQYHFKHFSLLSVLLNRQPRTIVSYPKLLQYGAQDFSKNYIFLGPCSAFRKVLTHNTYETRPDKRSCYISLGTILNDNVILFHHLITSLLASDFDIYIADGALILNLPIEQKKRIHVKRFYEQIQLLPHMDVFLCGGGINSVCESILAGVPCLLFPQQGEQKICSSQVEAQGFGYIANVKLPLLPQIEKCMELKKQWKYDLIASSFQLHMEEALQYIKQTIHDDSN